MSEKFGRKYEILILTPDGELLTIKPPFSVKFTITRNVLASVNKCDLIIYNLSPKTRNRIFKDRYSISEYWQLVIRAGYDRLSTVFQGNIYELISYKEKTEWYTKIDAFDGLNGIQNGFIAQTISKNTEKKDVFRTIIKKMPTLIAGVMGGFFGSSSRGKTLFGQSAKVLQEETDNNYFIDSETVNILMPDEYIGGNVLVLDSAQLFATPKRRDTFIDVDILFFPEAQVGILCEIRSLEEIYNGQYKVLGFRHDVTISQAISGTAKTSLSLDAGAKGLREVT